MAIPALPPLAPQAAPVTAAAPIACLPPDKPMPCKIMGHKEMHCQYKCCKYYADGRRVLVKGCTHGRRDGTFGVPKGLPGPPKP